ncbi:MAG: hypothetical protein ACRDDY_14155 [Clostridium sp.]|uniref:hypothetical protein n=1 Tax=Clostridium sp. TaxID=1506 RepID=UPI003EE81EA1
MSFNKKILAELEVVATGNKFEIKNVEKVYVDNLPEGVTPEVVKQVRQYDAEFDTTIYEAALPKMVDLLKTDKKIGLVEMEAAALGRTYGIAITRPEADEPTKENYIDAISLYVSEEHSSAIGDCLDRAVTLWSN